MKVFTTATIFLIVFSLFLSCKKSESNLTEPTSKTDTEKSDTDADSSVPKQKQFGVFKIMEDNKTIEMDGEIFSSALNDFNSLVAIYPDVNKINIIECGGSADDEINLLLSREVHKKNIVYIY